MSRKRAVLLVDNKQRDLMGCTLVAEQLDALGVDCFLEPLEAYRGCLAAHRPDMIIFNHLTGGHLVRYSRRLAAMNVKVAVLTNEGITYDPDLLRFIVGSHHSQAHIDLFLCWNEPMKRAMEEMGAFPMARKVVVGIPRFDFYCPPWSGLFVERTRPAGALPRVLVCTDFHFADFHGVPEAAEVFFGALKDRLPIFSNYKELIGVQHEGRCRLFPFLDELARLGRHELIVRPHPYEQETDYAAWMQALPAAQRANVRLDKASEITRLILNTDLQISCETCTTAMEGWIARKPTIELTFRRHPIFFHEEHAHQQPLCDRPADLPALVEEALANPAQPDYAAGRKMHLQKWCHTPDGNACQQVARAIADSLKDHPAPDWSQLTLTDRRRAAKLHLTRKVGHAYHFDPFMPAKARLFPKKYALKDFSYRKSIRPRDVAEARRWLRAGAGLEFGKSHTA